MLNISTLDPLLLDSKSYNIIIEGHTIFYCPKPFDNKQQMLRGHGDTHKTCVTKQWKKSSTIYF